LKRYNILYLNLSFGTVQIHPVAVKSSKRQWLLCGFEDPMCDCWYNTNIIYVFRFAPLQAMFSLMPDYNSPVYRSNAMELSVNALQYKACMSTVAYLRKYRVMGHEKATQKCLQLECMVWSFMNNCANINSSSDILFQRYTAEKRNRRWYNSVTFLYC
jgi:hypothetical protein